MVSVTVKRSAVGNVLIAVAVLRIVASLVRAEGSAERSPTDAGTPRRLSAANTLDDYILGAMARQRIPGLSLAVVTNGAIARLQGYGMANLELGTQASPDTLYGLGSISKQFTAAAIMLLVERGQVGLDDNIARHLHGLPANWGGVSIRHLLTHTSGIREEAWEGGIIEFDRREHSQAEVIKTAFGPVLSQPGEKWLYRNVGYRLLGMVVEKASSLMAGGMTLMRWLN